MRHSPGRFHERGLRGACTKVARGEWNWEATPEAEKAEDARRRWRVALGLQQRNHEDASRGEGTRHSPSRHRQRPLPSATARSSPPPTGSPTPAGHGHSLELPRRRRWPPLGAPSPQAMAAAWSSLAVTPWAVASTRSCTDARSTGPSGGAICAGGIGHGGDLRE